MKTQRIAAFAFVAVQATATAAAAPGILNHQGRIIEGGANYEGPGHFKCALVDEGTDTNVRAAATATVTSGFITSFTVVNPGNGYLAPPAVSISDTTGSGARVTAVVEDGAVTSITVDNPGSGYTAPRVTIGQPTAPPVFVTLWSNDGTSAGGGEPDAACAATVTKGHFAVPLGDTAVVNMTSAIDPAIFASNEHVYLRTWFSASGDPGSFERLLPDRRLTASPYSLAADRAAHAVDADHATTADLATHATTAGSAATAGSATTAGFATSAGSATTATSALSADSATTAAGIDGDLDMGDASITDVAALGIGTGTPTAPLHVTDNLDNLDLVVVESTGDDAKAIVAHVTGPDGIGVHATATHQRSVGVYGESTSTLSSNTNFGKGVHGHANATHSAGVYGTNDASSGRGMLAHSTGTFGHAILAEALGTHGRYAVYGHAEATSTTAYGVIGYAPSSGQDADQTVRGVYGLASAQKARAVFGNATGARSDVSDKLCGVFGYVNSTNGYGVYSDGNMGTSGSKAFIQPHPEDPSQSIRFVCLEGNENGTYFRGTGSIDAGRCEIDIPKEWRLVTAEDGITVQVTPLGDARMWVEEQSREQIVVRASADVKFNYFVNGVRRGFTKHQPFIPNYGFRPAVRGAAFGNQFPDELREILVANGTLNPDYTPNEETAERLGWELLDPESRDARDEYPWAVQDALERRRAREGGGSAAPVRAPAPGDLDRFKGSGDARAEGQGAAVSSAGR